MALKIGNQIAALRKSQRITQAQLAEYLAVQPQTVSRWEAEGGVPDVTLLPRIALFFGVSLDELFGITDMEQIDQLVYKYSVLRDDKSFNEVIRSIENAVSSISDQLKTALENERESLTRQRDQLLAWKVHVYIQKSRAAMAEAEALLDELAETVCQTHPLYLPLKLQKQQFLIQRGEGRSALEQARRDWDAAAALPQLHCLLAAYLELERGNEVLRLWEQDAAQALVSPLTADTLPLWDIMFHGAVIERDLAFFTKYFTVFKGSADDRAVFAAGLQLAALYRELGMEQEKAALKNDLLAKLDVLPLNEYLCISYQEQIARL